MEKYEFNNEVLNLLKSKKYALSNIGQIASTLKLERRHIPFLQKTLNSLVKSGQVARVKGDRYCIAKEVDLITGTIDFRQSGRAFIYPSDGSQAYSVGREDTGIAMHGDKVLAREVVKRIPSKFFKGKDKKFIGDEPCARVIKVIERKNSTVVGTLKRSHNLWHIVPDDPRFYYDVIVTDVEKTTVIPKPVDDDKVVVRLNEWTQKHLNPTGFIVENLGKSHTPMAEYKAIISKYDLNEYFSMDVMKEVSDIPNSVSEKDMKGRLDLRSEFTVTIDPIDAKDFDDAISLRRNDEGGWEVGVHIADVSYYVRHNSALDKEALKRGNSTYLVGTVIPMLPFELSNGICSLVENEDRLVKSVFLNFDSAGDCTRVDFANSVIRSNKRLSYEQAYALLKEDDLKKIKEVVPPSDYQTAYAGLPLSDFPDPFLQKLRMVIRQFWSIAYSLRKRRMKKGSLDLDMPDVKIYCNEQGYADKISLVPYDESHQLIEEYMLAANEAVARELSDVKIPFISRVHDDPDEEKLEEFRDYLESFGIKTGDLTKRREVMKVLHEINNHSQGYILKTQFLRSLKKACYRASIDGHYGLMKIYYAHFTSPIRRYADLTVHRCLDFYMQKAGMGTATRGRIGSPTQGNLESISAHISKTEEKSTQAERDSKKVKLMEYFERSIDTDETFEAIITDIMNHGFFIELTESMQYGFVHTHSLTDDIYRINDEGNVLKGRKTGKRIKLGDRIKVRVDSVDRFKRQVDFVYMGTNA